MYREELLLDFRAIYNTSINEISLSISVDEAMAMIKGLAHRTDSWYFAKLNKWDYPMDRGNLILLDIFDAFRQANSKQKPKPSQRPFKPKESTVFSGTPMSKSEADIVYANVRANLHLIKGKEEPLWQPQVELRKRTSS